MNIQVLIAAGTLGRHLYKEWKKRRCPHVDGDVWLWNAALLSGYPPDSESAKKFGARIDPPKRAQLKRPAQVVVYALAKNPKWSAKRLFEHMTSLREEQTGQPMFPGLRLRTVSTYVVSYHRHKRHIIKA